MDTILCGCASKKLPDIAAETMFGLLAHEEASERSHSFASVITQMHGTNKNNRANSMTLHLMIQYVQIK